MQIKRKVKIVISAILLLVICAVALICFLKPAFIFGYTDRDLQEKLRKLERQSDTIIIRAIWPEGPDITLSGDEVKEFFSLLKLEFPEEYNKCLCAGNLQFTFLKSGKELTSIYYHHGISVRDVLPINSHVFIPLEYQAPLRSFLEKRGAVIK